ncbi:hypothetical protein A4U49_06060 [Acidithiobacillus ferrivorans]|uniref:lytic transglycosylase domain-containing protein n=1 Tax=Acidithiobacillus ferrivorans TaxID=160808 RepID=UPI000893B883|nr:lytic transglycosylase domain-containing protein [Acidithiobacillus ferrivorans]OFA16742.1 hypothetical protein A4U49_06060 [Acidithiobacillus ferrivorans]
MHLPPAPPAISTCIQRAAAFYHEPPLILDAIHEVERGWRGARILNTNGTHDHGYNQINTIWRQQLHAQGYTMREVTNHDCANVFVSAWILRQDIHRAHGFWRGVGWYNSQNPYHAAQYMERVWKAAYRLTHPVTAPAPGTSPAFTATPLLPATSTREPRLAWHQTLIQGIR